MTSRCRRRGVTIVTRFHQGDAYELPARMSAEWVAERPRPLLVIED